MGWYDGKRIIAVGIDLYGIPDLTGGGVYGFRQIKEASWALQMGEKKIKSACENRKEAWGFLGYLLAYDDAEGRRWIKEECEKRLKDPGKKKRRGPDPVPGETCVLPNHEIPEDIDQALKDIWKKSSKYYPVYDYDQ